MARQKRQKSMIRAPAKTMERDIVHRAERLAKDPSLALPVIVPPATKDPFTGVRRKMERISRFADDEKRLGRFAAWGDHIARAYAGTLMLAAAGKAPYMAAIKLPDGDVPYAQRGKAKKEKLAGMQWYDHPRYRLLLFHDMSRGRAGLHFYSTPKALYCSGRHAGAPKEYVAYALSQVKSSLQESAEGVWTCSHLDAAAVKEGRPVEGTYVRLWWKSAHVAVGVCDRCARSRGGSTLMSIATYMAVPNLEEDFELAVPHLPRGAGDCEVCAKLSSRRLDHGDATEYFKGELDDAGLVERRAKALDGAMRDHAGAHFVMDGRCFGTDPVQLVESLSPTEEERLALEAVLPGLERPLVLEGTTPSKVLADLWAECGREALMAVTDGDEALVERYLEDPDGTVHPSKVLRRAMVEGRKRGIISQLPEYRKLPLVARFSDRVARAHKTEGADGAVKVLERERGTDPKLKSVAYAFLLVMGRETNREWQYERTEKDFAQFLRPAVERLLDAPAEGYHAALQALLSATGSTERLPDPEGGEA
jgi:hypothetical protein